MPDQTFVLQEEFTYPTAEITDMQQDRTRTYDYEMPINSQMVDIPHISAINPETMMYEARIPHSKSGRAQTMYNRLRQPRFFTQQ